MQISNSVLVVLLVITIVISVVGTFFNLSQLEKITYTGFAVNTSGIGLTNLSVQASIGVVVSDVDLGSGGIGTLENLTTDQDNTALGLTGWKDCRDGQDPSPSSCEGMNINNSGNVDVNVTFGANATGASLLGATGAANDWFLYQIWNGSYGGNNSGGCNGSLVTDWATVPDNDTPTLVCANLTPGSENSMHAEFSVQLGTDEPTGQKRTSIYVFAECIEGSPTC